MIRPSSLPMLAECPQFVSGGDDDVSEYADAGTLRHKALYALLAGDDDKPLLALPEVDRSGVQWAAEQIRLLAPMSDYPLECEVRDSFVGPNFIEISGTPDVVCGPYVFDLKWRPRNYDAQMAAYAGMRFDKGWEKVDVYLLFGATQRKSHLRLDSDGVDEVLLKVINPLLDKAPARPCEYCDWCSKRLTCPARLEQVNALAAGREDWELEQYHASKIETPEEMGKALRLAKHVAKWAESVIYHAREMAVKRGVTPTGYKVTTKQGNRYVSSVTEAYARLGMPQDKFLELCSVSLPKLCDAYRQVHGLDTAAGAEKEVVRKLGEVIQRAESSVSLTEIKEKQ